ncbi:unnamed protein product, partial [Ectocarpus sp. 12 AP-2014]
GDDGGGGGGGGGDDGGGTAEAAVATPAQAAAPPQNAAATTATENVLRPTAIAASKDVQGNDEEKPASALPAAALKAAAETAPAATSTVAAAGKTTKAAQENVKELSSTKTTKTVLTGNGVASIGKTPPATPPPPATAAPAEKDRVRTQPPSPLSQRSPAAKKEHDGDATQWGPRKAGGGRGTPNGSPQEVRGDLGQRAQREPRRGKKFDIPPAFEENDFLSRKE